MKKMKKLFILLLVVCSVFNVVKVNAISEDIIEENDSISIPWFISSEGTKITVYDTDNYDLYGQWLEITREQYNEIYGIHQRCNQISKEGNSWADENRPSSDDYATTEEYQAAVKEFNSKIDEYNNQIDACNTEYYNAIPDFDESKWEKLINDTVYLPGEVSSEEKPFILYLKLDDKQNSIVDYEFAILELSDGESDSEVINPEIDDTNWDKLKKGIKNNEFIKWLDNEENSVSFDDSDPNTFIIEVEGETGTYKVTLNYRDGVVTYNTPENEPEGFELIHSMVISGVIQEVGYLFGYETEPFFNWLEENEGKLTLVGNGIQYTIKEYDYSSSGEGFESSVSGDYWDSLSVRINVPLTGYANPTNDEKEPSPETGDLNMLVFAGAALVLSGIAVVAYRKTKLN